MKISILFVDMTGWQKKKEYIADKFWIDFEDNWITAQFFVSTETFE